MGRKVSFTAVQLYRVRTAGTTETKDRLDAVTGSPLAIADRYDTAATRPHVVALADFALRAVSEL